MTFPVKDGLLHQQLLSEDGNVPLYQDFNVYDINNPYHGRTIAATNLLISRRGRLNTSIDLRTGFQLEPGDVLTYDDPIFNESRYYKTQETELNRAAVNLTMLDFDKDDTAWFVDEQDTFENIDVLVSNVPPPTALTGVFDEDTRLVTLTITPSTDEDYDVVAYDIGVSADGATTWDLLTSIAEDLDDDDENDITQTYVTTVGIDAGTVNYRVRSKALTGEVSDWLVSADITITEIEIKVITGFTTSGDTVTVTFSDGTTDDFTVPGALTVTDTSTDADGNIVVTFSDGSTATIPAGDAGRGITSIVRDDTTGVVTVTYDDSTTAEFTVNDGTDGTQTAQTAQMAQMAQTAYDGTDGADGTDGEDGVGYEEIFAATRPADVTPSDPDDTWGYGEPESPWHTLIDDTDLSLTFTILWATQRPITGQPSVGDAVTGTWETKYKKNATADAAGINAEHAPEFISGCRGRLFYRAV